ncbi:MAG: hypothetical protein RBT45_08075 [Acholeplasmataceae bacterium]|nr:hypothetical protein [Acholeplasmataceae bacterium]
MSSRKNKKRRPHQGKRRNALAAINAALILFRVIQTIIELLSK